MTAGLKETSKAGIMVLKFLLFMKFFHMTKTCHLCCWELVQQTQAQLQGCQQLQHWDTGIAVLHTNNTTNSSRNFGGQTGSPDVVFSAHVSARYAIIWGHKYVNYVNWVVNHEWKIQFSCSTSEVLGLHRHRCTNEKKKKIPYKSIPKQPSGALHLIHQICMKNSSINTLLIWLGLKSTKKGWENFKGMRSSFSGRISVHISLSPLSKLWTASKEC